VFKVNSSAVGKTNKAAKMARTKPKAIVPLIEVNGFIGFPIVI
jgi:hypothetical protein